MDYGLLIDGAPVAGDATLDVINPATGQVLATAPRASAEQAERAVAAARRAFPSRSELSFAERRVYLDKLAAALGERIDEFARS